MKIALIWVILIILIIGKFIGLINISWLWIFSLVWIPIMIILGLIILITLMILLLILINPKWEIYD